MAGSRRILAINPNTSEDVTRAFLRAARPLTPEGVEIDGVTGRFGSRIVSTAAENLIAGHSALELAAEHLAGHDGVILAISFDTALTELRSLLSVPVVGITEAAVAAANAHQGTIGAVIFGAASLSLYEDVVSRTASAPLLFEAVEISSVADYLAPGAKDKAVLAAIERLADGGAVAVVILGAAIVGMARRVAPHAPVPVYDGTAAVAACMAAIDETMVHARSARPIAGTIGLSPALAALLAGRTR